MRSVRRLAALAGVAALVAGTSGFAQAATVPTTRRTPVITQTASTNPGAPASADAAKRFAQVTGERLLDTPTSRPCVETIVRDYAFKNTAYGPDKNFHARYAPPHNCPGPWSRVVATVSGHVTGVQFDRVGDLRLGRTDIFAYSTPEPRGDHRGRVTWTKSKDVTDYTNLFEHPQRLSFEIGNVVEGPYDGIYYGTLKLTFYPADAANPVPVGVPDRVLPVIREGFLSDTTQQVDGSVKLPHNASSITADFYLQGHGGCDEFWWADAPPPFPGQCGSRPIREAMLYVDGQPAGLVNAYPYLFTGADGPSWWEPIPAPQAFNLRPWRLDLTPYVGLLADGQEHQIAVRMPDWNATSGNFFRVNLALLVDTTHRTGQTVGAVTSVSVPPHPKVIEEESATAYRMDSRHILKLTGWYRTAGGPTVQTFVQEGDYATSRQNLSRVNDTYTYQQTRRLVTPDAKSGGRSTVTSNSTEVASLAFVPNGWHVGDDGTTSVFTNGSPTFASSRHDQMSSTTTPAGRHVSSEHWSYADTSGTCGTTHLEAANPLIRTDVTTSRCIW